MSVQLENFETPYEDAEDAFFAMVNQQEARADGARYRSGLGLYQRPGGGLDVQKVIERLHREQRLSMDHIRVLKHYGVRRMAPDERRPKELRAAHLWKEAMDMINNVLKQKGLTQ